MTTLRCRWHWLCRIAGGGLVMCAAAAGTSVRPAEPDYRQLVSGADLTFTNPAARSESGLPVGNGRMGSLVWTTPSSLRLQINRVDVFANNCASTSFPERHTDYCGGCGFVDIEAADGAEVFPVEGTLQRLSCYEGLAAVEGKEFKTRVLAWMEKDVMAVEVSGQHAPSDAIRINLRMLRPPVVKTGRHTARSKLEIRDRRIILTQEFAEGGYFCGSAVALGVVGRDVETVRSNETTLHLAVRPGAGTFTVLIASAASFDRKADLAASAIAQLDDAAAQGFARVLESNRAWWIDFWSKSFIHLHSADGVADEIERHYTYFLYLMASTSRGPFPTKFNGMLWTTGGDRRQWGSQFWGANQSCLYNNALLAANHPVLLDPMFDMLSGMLDACSLAARQQWGSQGAFYPETVFFDGLAPLPDDIAAEMRDLYMLRKPWDERSKRFLEYAASQAPHSSRWNWIQSGRWEDGRWIFQERGGGPFGPVTHIFSRGAKYAYQFWLRYEYTQDSAWLRQRAYPVIKAVAEFYRNFPNVKKGGDGLYHIHHVNSNESVQGAHDTDEEIASMRSLFPVLIAASRILDADHEMRPVWQEFLDNLAPLPLGGPNQTASVSALQPAPLDQVWIRGRPPAFRGSASGRPDGNTMPQWFFDLCTLESDPATFQIGNATLDQSAARSPGVLSKIPLVAAIMGRADAVRSLVPAQFKTADRSAVLANRMDLREGPQTTSAQRLGNASDALHTALCCDLPPGPALPSVIRVFAAWPQDWDAEFRLLCRGGFLVSSAMRKGTVPFVEIQSQRGGVCRLRNPWAEGEVSLYRSGKKAESLTGPLLQFDTRKGETIAAIRPGPMPDGIERIANGKQR
ncbi:MAG: glycoside hydrolase N-terminal domain-containing protein [Verrucomicrobia bacterium]|nr:glycoside hydrolase N-terminal domain-containing protein [Verrucomicrobiota bacterium]